MNKPATVTVGISFFNDAAYLDWTIQSVVNQTYTDWELLLVDDGSTDGSLAIATRHTNADARIQVYSDGKNCGFATRFNQLCQLANGRYIAVIDHDDLMVPDRLAKQVAFLNQHPEYDLVCSYAYSISVRNEVYGLRKAATLPTTLQAALSGCIIHPTIMAKAEWFQKYPYNPAYNRVHDAELWSRTFDQSPFGIVTEPLVFYRELGMPYTAKYLRSTAELRRLYASYIDRLGWWPTRISQLKTVAKDLLYRAFNAVGQENKLIERRSKRLTPDQQRAAQALLTAAITPLLP